jgi:uncharacterized phage-like protein YoqJ
MNPNEQLNRKDVVLFKNVLLALLEELIKSGLKFQLLAVAVAAEEFAAELRKRAVKDFKNCPPIDFPRSGTDEAEEKQKKYPEWIGGE